MERNESEWKNDFNRALKKASANEITKIADRLSVPKNYSRLRYNG